MSLPSQTIPVSKNLQPNPARPQLWTKNFRHHCAFEGGELTVELKVKTLEKPDLREVQRCPRCGEPMTFIDFDDDVTLALKALVDESAVDFWWTIATEAVGEFGERRVVEAIRRLRRQCAIGKRLWPRAYFRALCQASGE